MSSRRKIASALGLRRQTLLTIVTMQHCPKCGSSRVRRGYVQENLLFQIIGYRELLCNNCNLRFNRIVLPGTMPKSGQRDKRGRNETRSATTATEPSPIRNPKHQHENSRRCPKCESSNTHRSSRRGFRDKAISLLSVYPYRCHECEKRFYARRSE